MKNPTNQTGQHIPEGYAVIPIHRLFKNVNSLLRVLDWLHRSKLTKGKQPLQFLIRVA